MDRLPSEQRNERLLTELDHQRLSRWARSQPALQQLLDSAELLPSAELPDDIVSMNSAVQVMEPASGRTQQLTLCYPSDALPEQGRVSVLSPVGLGLLGLAIGQELRWTVGNTRGCLQLQALLYQPETHGDFDR
ncbi:GreA/GreB family elongation factor [Pelomonas sp. V22]|uniref:GreA/GreB family elongation factor n=1 Tax=Pelomonas sp. V22 TaxID=2822139 RepID=UPI0024A7F06D|nr:GreA/GreB family elongation factor [Pelomonas sp. V22]MDI4633195.1 GreA/GreB family elongation factor [Pelomonas sp. V22]